jgi:hypothetical protein
MENLALTKNEANDKLKAITSSPLFLIGVFGVGSFFIYKIYTNYTASAETRNLQKALDQITKVDGSKLTITPAEASVIAQQLFVAMDGIGTDEKTIFRLLIDTPRTDDDIRLIVKAFGLKEYGTFGSPWWGSGTPCDLGTWFVKEMSGSDLQKLRNRFALAGISF